MTASPRFDVVLRGYDRRQVDEYVAGLLQALGRMQAELDEARRQQPPPGQPGPRNRPGQPPPPRPAQGRRLRRALCGLELLPRVHHADGRRRGPVRRMHTGTAHRRPPGAYAPMG